MAQHRILIVDDHPLVREGLRQLFERERDLVVCGEAGDGPQAHRLVEELAPDVVTLDISLPGPGGLTVLKDLLVRRPALPVLVISMHDESLYAERSLRAGARGYMNKQETRTAVVPAVRRVLAGEIYLSERVTSRFLRRLACPPPAEGDASSVASLSDRELEVFQMVGRGLGPTEIAQALHVCVKTVQAHKANIRQKLGLKNARALAMHAMRWPD